MPLLDYILQDYFTLSVGDASHQPLAGSLEATALAGIGQNADEEIDEVALRRDSHKDLVTSPVVYPNTSTPTSATALNGSGLPEQFDLGETTIATTNTQTSARENAQLGNVELHDVSKLGSMPAGYVLPDPDPNTPPPRSCTNLVPGPHIQRSGATLTPIDDEGYLKLKVPSNLHLDEIGAPSCNGPDGNSHASQEECSSERQAEPSASLHASQENVGATCTYTLGKLNDYGHLANGDVDKEGSQQTISQRNDVYPPTDCTVKSKPDSNESSNDRSKFRKQSFSRSKQLTRGCIETAV